jgi:predicted enzyme related to lactoylglutathione lyase
MGKEPTYANGKICYIMIPADDINVSSQFYKSAFGWNIRTRSDGRIAFDDGAGEVSGTWITGKQPLGNDTVTIYIMVDNIEQAIKSVTENGGEITQPLGMDAPEKTAKFRDPAGNIFGLYENP